MYSPFQQYQNIQVTTSKPEKILLMLYDGVVNFTSIALNRLRKGDLAGKGYYIGKAHAIVAELMNTLDHKVAPDLTADLQRLYNYLIHEYVTANATNSEKPLENALHILGILRQAWRDAVASLPENEGISVLKKVESGR